ncbi:MAG: PD40 domain-containing protein, partial [Bacteroidetes bacterium]|nr:PD40 domain-containing protein [Bacteroidota bacterium]
MKDSQAAFDIEQYAVAGKMLEKEYNEALDQSIKGQKAFMIGECYRRMGDHGLASDWYKISISLNYKAIAIYWYAQTLKTQEKYNDAILQFTKYAELEPAEANHVQEDIATCEMSIRWKQMKTKYDITALNLINSDKSDYCPTFYENNALVFTSDRQDAQGRNIYGWTGEKYSDIFIAQLDNANNYMPPQQFPGVNTEFNEGVAVFNTDFTEMFFTRCASGVEELPDICKLWYTNREPGGKWNDPVPLMLFPDSIEEGHPTLSEDGMRLIFTAEAPDGYGGHDLYVVTKTSDGWGTPVNLGDEVNTEKDEYFPFLHADGDLYFASNGHPGMGGFDLFWASSPSGDSWKGVKNMLPPINSGSDDFGIMFNEYGVLNQSGFYESSGFFSSNRPGGRGSDDIYKFVVEKPAYFSLDGEVLKKVLENSDDPNSKVLDLSPIPNSNIELMIFDSLTGKIRTVETSVTDENGEFSFILEPNSEYKVVASQPGFFTKSEFVSTKGI